MNFTENVRIVPLYLAGATKTSTTIPINHIGGDFEIVCQVGYAATDATVCVSTVIGQSDTSADFAVSFAIYEGTAATSAGSAISGATLTLGPSTVLVNRGGVNLCGFQFTSALTTAQHMIVNGVSYNASATVTDGTKTATVVYKALKETNGQYLNHYDVLPNLPASGCIIFQPNDNEGTGLTLETTAADSTTLKGLLGLCQGVIRVNAGKLSTASPKYISVSVGESTMSVAKSVMYVADGRWCGAEVNLTTNA